MAPSQDDPAGYESVRRKLLERGYLEGRVERFLLKDLVGPSSTARRLASTGLKAAAVGGPVLGALLAWAAVAANRPLLNATDAPLLWLYFAFLSGAGLFLLDVGAAVVVGAIARRRGARPGDAPVASMLVGIPILAYLVLLRWAGPRDAPLGEDLLFLAAALVVTLVVSWLAGLVSLAGIIGRTGEVPDRRRRTLLVVALSLLPVVAAFLVVRGVAGDPAGDLPASPFEPRPPAGRLLFVGIDGLDGSLVEALEPRGAVRGLLEGMRRGAVFPMRRAAGREPPEVWTTILTGMPSRVHGVRSVGGERLPGVATPLRSETGPAPLAAALRFLLPARTVPTTGAARRARALWEIVNLKGSSAAVGWWASWPAHGDGGGASRGFVVSDRVLPKLLSGGKEDRDTAPESLFAQLAADFEHERGAIRAEFDAEFPAAGRGKARRIAWESFLIDEFAWRTAHRLLENPEVAAAFVYLPGLDILRQRTREGGGTGAVDLLDRQASLESYVRWLDRRVGEWLSPAPGGIAVVVADPGREATTGAEGFAVVAGGGVKAGCVATPVSDLDIAPLVLDLLGYPASQEMPGRARGDCLPSRPEPRERIASYGRRAPPAALTDSDYDREMVERLRALGYLR